MSNDSMYNVQQIEFASEIKNLVLPAESSHKYEFGHVVIIGSNIGMLGSSILSAKAAFRSGAGLVTVITHPEHANLIPISINEAMSKGVNSLSESKELLNKASIIVLGPGLGKDDWAKKIFKQAIELDKPMIIDADALNLLVDSNITFGKNIIITPHLGEAAKLLNTTVLEIQKDKIKFALSLKEKYQCNVLLKSEESIIVSVDSNDVFTINAANFGMATAGMGDLLTGVIAGLHKHTDNILSAIKLGVCLHAKAGSIASKSGKRGMLASDLLNHIRELLS